MTSSPESACDDVAGRGGQVVQAEDLLGLGLVHGQRRGQHARAGVGDAQHLEQPLDAAVLAVAAVQRQERDVDAGLAQHQVDVAIDEDRRGVVAPFRAARPGWPRPSGSRRPAPPTARRGARRSCDDPSSFTGNLPGVPRQKNRRSERRPISRVGPFRGRPGDFVVKTGAMTFLEAALEILRREGKPLHFKDLTERAMGKKLLTFVGRTPEVTMQTQLTAAVKKAPGSPFVRVKPGVFGLLRYPEMPPEDRRRPRARSRRRRPAAADAERSPDEARGRRRRRGTGAAGAAERRRRATDRPAGDGKARRPGRTAKARGRGPRRGGTTVEHEPTSRRGGSVGGGARGGAGRDRCARKATTATTTPGDEEDRPWERRDGPFRPAAGWRATPAGDPRRAGRRRRRGRRRRGSEGEGAEADGEAGGGAAGETRGGEAGAPSARPHGAGKVPAKVGRGGSPSPPPRGRGEGEAGPPAAEARTGEAGGGERAGAGAGESSGGDNGGSLEPSAAGSPAGEQAGEGGEGPGARRIMTPVDAAIEILRGQAPGRGVHVRQIADAAARRRLVHGEPNEAWRVMRTALAAEPRERLRAGPAAARAGRRQRPLRAGAPPARRRAGARRAGVRRGAPRAARADRSPRWSAASPSCRRRPSRRWRACCCSARVSAPTTFVKRVEGTIYVEALRGRGSRPSRCLVGLRAGGTSAGRRAIGELRAGIRARNQDEGLLLLAGRLAEDAIAEWKQPGAPHRDRRRPGGGRDLHPPRHRRHQHHGQRRLRRRRLLRRAGGRIAPRHPAT